MLSDTQIRRAILDDRLRIHPLDDARIQPASVDLTLGDEFLAYAPPVLAPRPGDALDPRDARSWERALVAYKGGYTLMPGEFVLGTTREIVGLSGINWHGRGLAGVVAGKSTLARLGLQVEAAGFIDPGFDGQITLEFYNCNRWPILLVPGLPVCQVVFHETGAVERSYGAYRGSGYQYQQGPTPPRSLR